MKKYILPVLAVTLVTSCSKDKNELQPKLYKQARTPVNTQLEADIQRQQMQQQMQGGSAAVPMSTTQATIQAPGFIDMTGNPPQMNAPEVFVNQNADLGITPGVTPSSERGIPQVPAAAITQVTQPAPAPTYAAAPIQPMQIPMPMQPQIPAAPGTVTTTTTYSQTVSPITTTTVPMEAPQPGYTQVASPSLSPLGASPSPVLVPMAAQTQTYTTTTAPAPAPSVAPTNSAQYNNMLNNVSGTSRPATLTDYNTSGGKKIPASLAPGYNNPLEYIPQSSTTTYKSVTTTTAPTTPVNGIEKTTETTTQQTQVRTYQ